MERTVVQLRFGPGDADVHSVAGESELPAARTPRPSAGDGRWQPVPHEVGKAAITRRNPHSETTRYLDFEVDDPFAFGVRGTSAEIAVTCVMRDSRLSAASTATWFPRGLWRVHFDRPEVSP